MKANIGYKSPGASLWLIYGSTALAAICLKLHYSRATVTNLAWILQPTAIVVGWVRRQPLVLNAHIGWIAPDGSFVIAPACAGVNFFILVFAISVVAFAPRFRAARQRWCWFVLTVVIAYGVTIAVNALRIVVAVTLYRMEIYAGWLQPERLHRLAGSIIYLAGLWAVWLVLDIVSSRLRHGPAAPGWVPVFVLPAAYICMTVVFPFLNGAWGDFGVRYREHAMTVSLLAVSTIPLLSLVRWATSWSNAAGVIQDAQTNDSGSRRRAGNC